MPKKLTYEFVKSNLDKEGYKLLDKEYKNSQSKLKYRCPRNHVHSISWDNWKQGYRCPYCVGVNKPSFEEVKNSFENDGYTLLSNKYVNNITKLKYRCPKGHEHSIIWLSWKQGQRCPYCSGNAKYRCPQGHEHQIRWEHWYSGVRCPYCFIIKNSGPGNPNWRGGKSFEPYCEVWSDKEYKQDIKDRDGNKCLNPYCSAKDPKDLTIHHIDYDKQNCHYSNLITVCRSCNSRANKDFNWHKHWYRAILTKRYNYKY